MRRLGYLDRGLRDLRDDPDHGNGREEAADDRDGVEQILLGFALRQRAGDELRQRLGRLGEKLGADGDGETLEDLDVVVRRRGELVRDQLNGQGENFQERGEILQLFVQGGDARRRVEGQEEDGEREIEEPVITAAGVMVAG